MEPSRESGFPSIRNWNCGWGLVRSMLAIETYQIHPFVDRLRPNWKQLSWIVKMISIAWFSLPQRLCDIEQPLWLFRGRSFSSIVLERRCSSLDWMRDLCFGCSRDLVVILQLSFVSAWKFLISFSIAQMDLDFTFVAKELHFLRETKNHHHHFRR